MDSEIGEINSHRLDPKDQGSTFLCLAAMEDDIELIDSLLDAGHDINEKDNKGFTPLHTAVTNNSNMTASHLIGRGADINIQGDVDRVPPLHTAIFNNNSDMVRLLVENKADVNTRNASGQSALDYAVCNDDVDMCHLLLENGALHLDPDPDGLTPMQLAINLGHRRIVRLFEQFSMRKSYL